MKMFSPFLYILLVISCANGNEKSGNEKTYIGSTPAGPVIKSFLGIPLSDSIDFIRWKIVIRDKQYKIHCNYGIGQPNTNGFINGGVKVDIDGECLKNKNYYEFRNGSKTLKAVELNTDLLHLLNIDNSLLIGNGGWSYTLSNIKPSNTDQVSITAAPSIFKDSISFEGRTPCNVPGVIEPGRLCYKLKWYIVLYAEAKMNKQGRYKVLGTPWRKEGGRTGNWKIITGKNGRTIYQLNNEKGNGFLYLLKLDEHILVFTDAEGKLLAGDEDFSYTLNNSR
jgi:hypothetical protein